MPKKRKPRSSTQKPPLAAAPLQEAALTSAPNHRWAGIAYVLLATAILVDGYLAWQSWAGGSLLGCGEGAGCEEVLKSRFGRILGLPAGALGLGVNAILFAAVSASRTSASLITRTAAWGALLGAAWFLFLQAAILGRFCLWCNTAHALSVAAVLIGRHYWLDLRLPAPAIASAAVLAIASLQWTAPEPARSLEVTQAGGGLKINPAAPDSKAEAILQLPAGGLRIPLDELPLLGRKDARHVIAAMTDYTCPHCRHMHRTLEDLVERYPDDLSVVLLPARRSETAADIQRSMLIAFRAIPQVYEQLAEELWHERRQPEPDEVRDQLILGAGGPAGWSSLESQHGEWAEGWVKATREQQLRNESVLHTLDLPQLFLADKILVGMEADPSILIRKVQDRLGLGTSTKAPNIELGTATFDLGPLFAATGKTVEVPFKNTGNATLRIDGFKDLSSGRPMTGPPAFVEPGEKSSVRIEVPIPNTPGPFEMEMAVLSNAPTRETPVRVKGHSVKAWEVTPSKVDLGPIPPNLPAKTVTVLITLDAPKLLGSPSCSIPGVDVSLRIVEQMRRYAIDISPSQTTPAGKQAGNITIPIRHVDPETARSFFKGPIPTVQVPDTEWPDAFAIPVSLQK